MENVGEEEFLLVSVICFPSTDNAGFSSCLLTGALDILELLLVILFDTPGLKSGCVRSFPLWEWPGRRGDDGRLLGSVATVSPWSLVASSRGEGVSLLVRTRGEESGVVGADIVI